MSGSGFAAVVPGKTFAFPADHGPHPDFRIEWWYVTANLVDSTGVGLWRAMDLVSSGDEAGRAAGRLGQSADLDGPRRRDPRDTHRYSETFARGGVGQAGVEATPFRPGSIPGKCAGSDQMRDTTLAPLELKASGADFATRCGSTPIVRWFCRATPATAGNRSADRLRIISASLISR
jgi:predicted secreted hydrolase